MEVRNCKNCGRMFNYIGTPLCPTCEKELENKFLEVRKYVREHKEASITQVAEENDVSVNQIKRWVRQERLAFTDASQVGLECENCGAMIRTGRFCDNCKAKMTNELSSTIKKGAAVQQPKQKESARMRFLDGK